MYTLKTRLAVAAVAALGLLAVAAPLAPATAQVYFGVGPYGVEVGPPAAYYYGGYYGDYYGPYGYPYHYWHHPHYYYYGW